MGEPKEDEKKHNEEQKEQEDSKKEQEAPKASEPKKEKVKPDNPVSEEQSTEPGGEASPEPTRGVVKESGDTKPPTGQQKKPESLPWLDLAQKTGNGIK